MPTFAKSTLLAVVALLALGTAGPAHSAPGDGATTAISAGESHSVALLDDGTVVTWGRNDLGQRGDGTFDWRYAGSSTISASPARVLLPDGSPLDRVKQVSGGYHCPVAIRDDGSVWSWGFSSCRPGGDAAVVTHSNTAVQVLKADGSALLGAIAVVGGVHHGIAVLDDGSVWSWGGSNLGTGEPASGRARQVRTSASAVLEGAVDVANKFQSPLVRLESGEVYQWTGAGYAAPVMLAPGVPISDATELEVGSWHVFITRADGTLWAWGNGTSGQLGNGASADQSYPVQVLTAPGQPLTGVADVEGTGDYSIARTSSGALYAWGTINASSYALPYAGPTSEPVDELATGAYHALIRVGGRVYGRGSNWAGQLADPSGADSSTWVPVNSLPGETRNGSASDPATGATARAGILRTGAAGTVLLEVSLADVDAGQLVTPWVEIVRAGTEPSAACGSATPNTHAGAPITSTGSRQTVTVAVKGLADEARYTWRSCAVDALGGASRWSIPSSLLLDGTAPSVTGAAAIANHAEQSATFTLGGADAGSGLDAAAYSFDDGATWQAAPTLLRRDMPWGVTVTVMGRVRDAAGNVSRQVPLDARVLDQVPPRMRPATVPRGWIRGGSLRLVLEDPETGIASTTASFLGEQVPVRNGVIEPRDLPEGQGLLRVTSHDGAGNPATWTRQIQVDRTAPTIAAPPRAVFGRHHDLVVRDAVSGSLARTTRVRLPRLGANVLRITVRDQAGNRSTRRVRIVRHLSLARPALNADLVIRRGSRLYIADQHAIRGSFRFVGHHAPWYAHTKDSPALVREAQWRLQRFGFLRAGRITGVLDITTIRAVQRYQASEGLPRLGTIGPRTRVALDADLLAGRAAGARRD